jgi:hypothetical protein
MDVDPDSGLLTWTPTAAGSRVVPVVLRVYDSRGGYDTQEFEVTVSSANHAPAFAPVAAEVHGSEGALLEIPVSATDADGDALTFWADHLPAGASFDAARRVISWRPSFTAAGTYEGVRFVVSDGKQQVSRAFTIVIAPGNQAPALLRPADRTVVEGQPVRIQLSATDPQGDPIRFVSNLLPGGAKLDPATGVFEWTPAFTQAGAYQIPFTATDGADATTKFATITVLNANAAPGSTTSAAGRRARTNA